MKKLITNSDDFGLTNSITDAIIDSHVNGIMTSTTMMPNMEGFDYAVLKAKEYPDLGVGIHFTLTEGKPLTDINKIPDLVNEEGEFKNNAEQRKNFLFGKSKREQVELELTSQLERLIDNGIVPTHFDSHHHITGTPVAFIASMNVTKKFGIKKGRITNIDFRYSKDHSGGSLKKGMRALKNLPKSMIHNWNKKRLRSNGFQTPDLKLLPGRVLPFSQDPIEQFIRTLSTLNEGTTEISFHPGYENSYLKDSEKTALLRIRDLKVANSSLVKEYITKNNIKLINFKNL